MLGLCAGNYVNVTEWNHLGNKALGVSGRGAEVQGLTRDLSGIILMG